MSNPFDLTTMISKEVKTLAEPHVYKGVNESFSDTQISDMLKNYEEVPKSDWGKLTPNIHVRYTKTDGAFKRGGYVVNQYVSNKEETKGTQMLRLKSNLTPGAKEWTLNLSGIETLHKNKLFKPKATPTSATEVIGGIKQTTDGLQNQVEQLSIEVSRLSNEQKRIIALIKKLHNINI
jgi:hypothetical protein